MTVAKILYITVFDSRLFIPSNVRSIMMNLFMCSVLVINIVFVYVNVVPAQNIVNSNNCWNANVQCNIEANLTRDALSQSFLVNFNCSDNVEHSVKSSYGFRQIKGVETIKLNGCNVTQNNTIGVEHIDDPISVTHLTICLFKTKIFYSKHLDKFKSLVTIKLIDNVFEEIINKSFQNVITVEALVLSNNNLKVIAPHAVVPLNHLKNLTIIEPNLSINELNLTFCSSLKHVWLDVYAYVWQALPTSTETLVVINTKLTFAARTLRVEHLKTVSITKSQFNEFPTIESSSLLLLNLTQNKLRRFSEHHLPNLEILDLSGNELKEIDANSFKSMVRLREMYADRNGIEKISKKAFDSNTRLEVIKIAGNRLKTMEFADHLAERPLQIFIDDNPWSCVWVLNVSSEHPKIFAIFHYNKYSNNLNVRGLNCVHYEADGYNAYESSLATEIVPISSTLPFDENIEISYRRNPKDTALITLIILVVGVAVLFFLLYLHIKCRENTVEPFYRSLPYDTHQMSDRIDIIRRNLPPTDYEAPIAAREQADLKEVIYEQIPEKFTNYDRIPEKFTVHEGFNDVNSVLSYT